MIGALLLLFALQAPAATGAVASSEEQASAAAAGVLAAGGNAVDAAVALYFALAVSYPVAGNLGGGGFFLYRAPDGQAYFLDFRETAPAAARADLFRQADGSVDRAAATQGWRAVAVPGAVPGMAAAHARWGSRPWAELIAPAQALARDGFLVDASEAEDLAAHARLLLADPLARETFFRADGTPLRAGDRCVQPRLAATLQRIAEEGAAALRAGPLVDGMLAASAAGGGILAAADFAAYEPVLRPVHQFAWRGMQVLCASPPSSGGLFLHQTLAVLDAWPLAAWGRQDPRSVLLIAEASAAAFADRNRFLGDPAGMSASLASLTSPARLAARRAGLQPDRYTPPRTAAAPRESQQTTHFSTVDAAGGAVACTTTLNGAYGAKVMSPGGFLMNNEMDDFAAAPGAANQFGLVQGSVNAIVPGRRPLSSMCPTIIVADGRVDAVLGSPGGPTILSCVLHVLLNHYVFGMDPRAAVGAPRAHRQDLPPTLSCETGYLTPAAAARLRELGQPLAESDGLGDVNAIFRFGDAWEPVSDPRASGSGLAAANPLPRISGRK